MKNNHKKIAIIGATGNVGRKLVDLCLQRKIVPPEFIHLYASKKSDKLKLDFNNHSYLVQDTEYCRFNEFNLVIFTTESDVSKKYVPLALDANTTVIDASSAYRLEPNVPLIVPPVNRKLISKQHKLYSHANCLANPIAVVLKPLHDYANATRVQATTYQSVSGAGKGPMDELYQQTQDIFEHKKIKSKYFPRPIAFNVIPQVGEMLDDGFSYEEFKIIKEVQKIVSDDIKIIATSVRVPVMIGHSIALSIEFEKPIHNLEEIKQLLSASSGIKLSSDNYMTPIEIEGKDEVHVGRIRRDPTVPQGILLWLVSDNLRRGAALDEVEMAEEILKL